MTKKKIEVGVVSENELLLFYDYLNSDIDNNQYAILVTNNRGKVYTARMIDQDGDYWYILKLLFDNKYQRIKKEAVRSFEIKKISN
ncbi:hypothetical protein [Salinicoccus kekensis]|uniref:Uncharacterized protein n=1 Tax=Salinicoccus kekensis TaxID=714307 RepID=A0A285UUN3_9STAP|nr:hypothetical protein [Salinicoccus kekensis]SOC45078.1 hypothetical protein SAMN05878391_2587 [Salinicoccus kekensis]